MNVKFFDAIQCRFRSFCALFLALFIAAASPAAAVASSGAGPTDRELTVAVDSELMRDDSVAANYIDVSAEEGIVTLSGRVHHLLARERAVTIARSVKGVLSVIDHLKVRPVPRSDAAIASDVRRAFDYEPALSPEDFEIAVRNAVVTLDGRVGSFQQKALAGRTVYGVRGVRAVVNRIEVVPEAHRPDEKIRQDILSRLKADIWVDAAYIKVQVDAGSVFLTGRVGSAAERRRAWSDAAVAGVRQIDDARLAVDRTLLKNRELRENSPPPTDAEIQDVLKRAYRQDPRIDAKKISVAADDGEVLLTGQVKNARARLIAGQDAENTTGVVWVKNLLKVRPEISSPLTPEVSYNAELAEQIRYAMLRDPYVSQDHIGISVQDGIVRLSGTVDSRIEKERAEKVASRKDGVVLVKNRIKVRDRMARGDDAQIRRAIREELFWSPFVDADDVVVVVSDGTAVLSGRASSLRERRAATKNAFDGGARRVVNRMKVAGRPGAPRP